MAYNSGYWEESERSLRKQLAEAMAENAALVAELQRMADEPPTLEEIAADLDKIEMLGKELAEARAEIERLKEYTTCTLVSIDSDMDDKDMAIIKRDKLIEQMRDALLLFVEGAVHDFHYVCQHRDNCLCLACQKARVKAALRAADGGEG